jgi:hypothetical protein
MKLILALFLAFAPGLLRADTVTLKDGQASDGEVQGFDQYFLDFKAPHGKTFHIPWGEVRSLSHTTTTRSWLEDNYITGYTLPEGGSATVISPLDPSKALKAALFPGFFIHGWGHREARDTDTFYSLLGAEAFGLLVGGFGVSELSGREVAGESNAVAQYLTYGGAGVFLLSWLWDVAFAYHSATEYNQVNGLVLQLQPLPQGYALGLGTRF